MNTMIFVNLPPFTSEKRDNVSSRFRNAKFLKDYNHLQIFTMFMHKVHDNG